MTAAVDHLVYGVPELSAGVARIAELLGVTPAPGGSHEGRGSHNALLSLGGDAYLEIIAPDPAQPRPPRPRPFGLDSLAEPRLVTFAVHADCTGGAEPAGAEGRLERWRAHAAARGYDPGPVAAGSRRRSDGSLLRWHLCQRQELPFDGAVPFLIDWRGADSPAASTPRGCRLLDLEVCSPEPEPVGCALRALGVAVRVRHGDRPGLRATLATPRGTVELR
ncbi:MAG: VOC family protein [Spirochaetaceae bacterium]|nr:VOC family protein [Spirochaetaceae bacterium]